MRNPVKAVVASVGGERYSAAHNDAVSVLQQRRFVVYAVSPSVSFEPFRDDVREIDCSDVLVVVIGNDQKEQTRIGLYVGYAHARGLPIFVYAPFKSTAVHVSLLHPVLGLATDCEHLSQAMLELREIVTLPVADKFVEAVACFQNKWKICLTS